MSSSCEKNFFITQWAVKNKLNRRTQEPTQASGFTIINRPNLQNLQISTKSQIKKKVSEKYIYIMEFTIMKLQLEFKLTKLVR